MIRIGVGVGCRLLLLYTCRLWIAWQQRQHRNNCLVFWENSQRKLLLLCRFRCIFNLYSPPVKLSGEWLQSSAADSPAAVLFPASPCSIVVAAFLSFLVTFGPRNIAIHFVIFSPRKVDLIELIVKLGNISTHLLPVFKGKGSTFTTVR
jgi:hypothetical protein